MKSTFYTLLSMFKFTLPDYSDLHNKLHSSCSNFSRNETPQRQRRFQEVIRKLVLSLVSVKACSVSYMFGFAI